MDDWFEVAREHFYQLDNAENIRLARAATFRQVEFLSRNVGCGATLCACTGACMGRFDRGRHNDLRNDGFLA